MTLQYEILKRLVKAANIKKMWTGMSTEELLENRRKQNARNRIPDLKDEAFDISRIEIMGCPVLKLIHKKKANKANLFLIGGGMISAPRPGSIKKALRFAKETGLDDTAYEMVLPPGRKAEIQRQRHPGHEGDGCLERRRPQSLFLEYGVPSLPGWARL